MPENQIASSRWEEILYYYVKSPISGLFVKNPQFDCKGFKIITHINQYFHPSSTVDSLGCISQLIDIKQGAEEPVIMLTACFSHLFASLKIRGSKHQPPLQVGFMLLSLLSTYQGMVEDFKLGCHSLTTASLQTIFDQCISYNKDPWKGPVGKDGKVSCNPSANAAGTLGSASSNPYDELANLLFNKILTIGAKIARTAVRNFLYAATHPRTNPTMQKTAPS